MRISFFRGLATLASAAALLLALPLPVRADGVGGPGGISVSPMSASLSPKARRVSFFLANNTPSTVRFRVKLVAWAQEDNKDFYQDTSDLLYSPPEFSVGQGESQVIRVGITAPATDNSEHAYRLIVTQIQDKSLPASQSGLTFLISYSVPIFVSPRTSTAAKLEWNAAVDADHSLTIHGVNTGTQHVRATEVRFLDAGGKVVATTNSLVYILPGSERTIVVPKTKVPTAYSRVEVATEAGFTPVPVKGS